MKRKKIIIGTRGSKLAQIYAYRTKTLLEKFYKDKIQINTVVTEGDLNQDKRLSEIGGKGLFTKKIENELLTKNIDVAVHALKDMTTINVKGLVVKGFLKRQEANEVLISRDKIKFNELKPDSLIGTSSLRREFQIKSKRKDLKFKIIRGNIETRIQKMTQGDYDAIILAKAGITSLNLDNLISETFDIDQVLPSAGQGVTVAQCRDDDEEIIKLLEQINHEETEICARSEKEVLNIIEGDCNTAIGVSSFLKKNKIKLKTELFSLDGKKRFFLEGEDNIDKGVELGNKIGTQLKYNSKGVYKK